MSNCCSSLAVISSVSLVSCSLGRNFESHPGPRRAEITGVREMGRRGGGGGWVAPQIDESCKVVYEIT